MRRALRVLLLPPLLLASSACSAPLEDAVHRDALLSDARATLDELHAAAAAADEARYFALFAPEGVFLGTDASERWTVDEFRAYAQPHFAAGKGWTYRAVARHVDLSRDGAWAWFDEALENEKLGTCRGSGVLRREGDAWRVVQYDLTIPIPNDLALEVAERIRRHARGE
jgi:hypothetical protein